MQTTSSMNLPQKQGESLKLCMAEVSIDSMKRFANKGERYANKGRERGYGGISLPLVGKSLHGIY